MVGQGPMSYAVPPTANSQTTSSAFSPGQFANSPAVKPAVPITPPAGTTAAHLAAANPNPALQGHAVVPTTDGGTVNSNTGAYKPPVPTVPGAQPTASVTPIGVDANGTPTGHAVIPTTPTTYPPGSAGNAGPYTGGTDSSGFSVAGYNGTQGSSITTPVLPGSGSITDTSPSTNPLTNSPELQAAIARLRGSYQLSPAEQDAQKQLNDINSSFGLADARTQGQPIAMPFITGQQAQLQREKAAETIGPAAALGLAQQNRTLAQNEAGAELGVATGQLSTIAGLNTKQALPFGSSTFTPASGAPGGGGPFGGSSTSSTPPTPGSAFDPSNAIDQMVQTYLNTGEMPSNIASMPQYAAVITQRANDIAQQQTGQPFNAAARKTALSTDQSSLGNLQTQYDQSNTSLGTVKANGKLLLDGLTKAGLNSSSLPIANAIQAAIAKGIIAPGDQAAFTNSLNTLQSEYAKMLMGTGIPTDQATGRAQAALPANLSAADLAKVLDRMVGEGTNAIGSLKTNIDTINKRINPYDFTGKKSATSSGSSGGSSSSGSTGWY